MLIETYLADRHALLPFFRLADDSQVQIDAYLSLGEILIARDGDEILGHLQIIETGEADEFELKSMAVRESRQNHGIGHALVEAAIAYCRERNGHRLVVSTATAGIDNLRFYQRQGFRMFRIVQDFFVPANGYPEGVTIDGIPLRDQVFFELILN